MKKCSVIGICSDQTAELKSQEVQLQTAQSWANAGEHASGAG